MELRDDDHLLILVRQEMMVAQPLNQQQIGQSQRHYGTHSR